MYSLVAPADSPVEKKTGHDPPAIWTVLSLVRASVCTGAMISLDVLTDRCDLLIVCDASVSVHCCLNPLHCKVSKIKYSYNTLYGSTQSQD